MSKRKKLTFKLHGLSQEKNAVEAAVFARKLVTLVRGLSKADRSGNNRKCLEFFITDLQMGSSVVEIEERQLHVKHVPQVSGIERLHTAFRTVSQGGGQLLNGSSDLLPMMKTLSAGANKGFSHIEVILDEDEETAVRVDSFFGEQASKAAEILENIEGRKRRRLFKGKSKTTLDGTLKAVDHRGVTKLALLVLTAGGAEIECVYNESTAPIVTPAFDQRSLVEAWAFYDGASALPRRLELIKATPHKQNASLKRWRGAFSIEETDVDEWAD